MPTKTFNDPVIIEPLGSDEHQLIIRTGAYLRVSYALEAIDAHIIKKYNNIGDIPYTCLIVKGKLGYLTTELYNLGFTPIVCE